MSAESGEGEHVVTLETEERMKECGSRGEFGDVDVVAGGGAGNQDQEARAQKCRREHGEEERRHRRAEERACYFTGRCAQVHMLNGGKTHTALQGQNQARVGCAARSRQGSLEWVSEQRAHSIGLAAAAVLVAPLVRVLSSAISSTMCAASENTAAVTMPARWWER